MVHEPHEENKSGEIENNYSETNQGKYRATPVKKIRGNTEQLQ